MRPCSQPYEAAQKLDRRTKQAFELLQTELRQLACFTSDDADIGALFDRIEPSAEVFVRLIGNRVKLVLGARESFAVCICCS
jgi:hypothetical protein